MKFLLDANLSPALKGPLSQAGHETLRVADLGLLHATDDDILQRADHDGCTVITADRDFPTMLALHRATTPSVVHLRHINEFTWQDQGVLLTANLPTVHDDLADGAIVSLSTTRMAIRRLPIV